MPDKIIWKLYKVIFATSARCVAMACLPSKSTKQIDGQLRYVSQLRHIIKNVKAYHNLHPVFAKQTYGDLTSFLQQYLSEEEQQVLYATLKPSSSQQSGSLILTYK